MNFDESINIVIAGEAGQGIESASEIISGLLHYNNFCVFSIPEYMSRIRGGCNSSLIKVSNEKSPCFSSKIDVLFALDNKAFEHLQDRITNKTISLDLKKKNFYIIGYVVALFKLNPDDCLEFIKNRFEALFVEQNIKDFKEGFEDGIKNIDIQIEIPANKNADEKIFLPVNDALGIGCIGGGCNFVPFYPMSPATFLQLFLTKHADEFSIVSKQVEDEICVINMAIGAWYAGARAIACTSGGGFDLMCEGVSLAGITESPIVINIAQRPGPATGLPTKTEQGDLNIALYGGHGSFPRIIYSPATIEDAFKIGQTAFDMADKFQVPVFVLTDQALLESSYSAKELIFETVPVNHFESSATDYKRYELSENPVSKRGIPNFGEGLVCVDSDEHDEHGWIIEDSATRETMVDKRWAKLDQIKNNIFPPYFVGDENYKTLIISWGSNFHVINEVIKHKKDFAPKKFGFLHFTQIYPLDKSITSYTQKAEKLIIIEQNATGDFAKLLKSEFDINFDKHLFKYNGVPYSVEEINDFLEKINEI